jgi:hypothetical protein
MQNTPNESLKPWEQQEGESEKAFEAFEMYLQMGPERSLAKAAQLLGKSTTLLEEWSRKHFWQSRVRAHRRWVARSVTEELLMGTADMRQRQTAAAIALQNQVLERLVSMSATEIEKLSVSEMLAMLKVGSANEAKARDIKLEDIEVVEALAAPTFVIEFIPSRPPDMVSVRLADGTCGYIPREALDRFKADYPDASVIA